MAGSRVPPGMRPLILLAIIAVPLASCGKNQPADRLDDNAIVANTSPAASATPAKRCGSAATYDLIKRELFRRAAEIGSKDASALEQVARVAALRVERPVVESQDEGLGSISCSASVALDLPPGTSVSGGRTSLSTDLDYVLQPSADGTGDVLTLPSPDAIIVPLATLTVPPPAAPRAAVPPSTTVPAAQDPLAPVVVHRPSTPPDPLAPIASANPSFDCARARTSGERAVCQDAGLAALDRRMADLYRAATDEASTEARAALRTTGRHFAGFRDNCPDRRCIADGYRARIREIDDIMRGDR